VASVPSGHNWTPPSSDVNWIEADQNSIYGCAFVNRMTTSGEKDIQISRAEYFFAF
jgi:hypothetical protein